MKPSLPPLEPSQIPDSTLEDIRKVIEEKLARMIAQNPQRMDYYRKYQEIVAEYNREKDRVTIEETFARFLDPIRDWRSKEQTRAEVEVSILDRVFEVLPSPPFFDGDKEVFARELFEHVWTGQRSDAA